MQVDVLATNEIVADHVHLLLVQHDLVNMGLPKGHHFYVSDYTESFEQTTRLFYKETVQLEYSPIFSGENAY
jgi:glutamate racemase